MNSTMILVSGWAVDQTCWYPIKNELGNNFNYIDINWIDCLAPKNKLSQTLKQIDSEVIVAGCSLGGLISIANAPFFEGKELKLILLATTSCLSQKIGYKGIPSLIINSMKNNMLKNKSSLLAGFFKNVYYPASLPSPIEEIEEITNQFTDEELAKGLDYLKNTDLRYSLKNIKNETLIFHGVKDIIIPVEQATFLHKHLSNSKLIKFKNAGHAINITHANEIAKSIKEFA